MPICYLEMVKNKMNKILCCVSKTLKITNVLIFKPLFDNDAFNINMDIKQMQSYIKIKGATQIGPLIQYSRVFTNENNELDMEIVLMLQCNNYIHNVEPPYSMESVIRVPNCMYCRYIGPEDKLKFAYDKIHLEAFENDIELEDCSYTIFVDRNEENETIVADVFIPRKDAK